GVQLPDGRDVGRARDRPAREAGYPPRGPAAGGGALRRSPDRHRGRRAAVPRPRGAKLVHLLRAARGGHRSRRRGRRPRRPRRRDAPVPAGHPPPAAVPGPLRLRGGDAAGHRARQPLDARAALLRPARGRRRRPRRSLAARGAAGAVNAGAPMIFLGYGKYVRADRIYALEPIEGDDRGDGQRTRVWIDGMEEPLVASRTERTILADMGEAVALAQALRRNKKNQMSLDV